MSTHTAAAAAAAADSDDDDNDDDDDGVDDTDVDDTDDDASAAGSNRPLLLPARWLHVGQPGRVCGRGCALPIQAGASVRMFESHGALEAICGACAQMPCS